jgi:hypothetical protein
METFKDDCDQIMTVIKLAVKKQRLLQRETLMSKGQEGLSEQVNATFNCMVDMIGQVAMELANIAEPSSPINHLDVTSSLLIRATKTVLEAQSLAIAREQVSDATKH